jgi:prefoldin subunit 5
MGDYVKKKKEMKFQSVEALQNVVDVVNESAEALNDKKRTIRESAIPEVLMGVVGAGIGAVGSFTALYALGTVGLSGPGIMSGLATAGGFVSTTLLNGAVSASVAGIFVLALPVTILAAGGVRFAVYLKHKQLKQEKERLYQEALKKHNAVLQALKDEADSSKDRIEYLNSLNTLLNQAIKDLKHDLGYAVLKVI